MKLNLLNITSIDFDSSYISHFCKYYQRFDIDSLHIILHTNFNASFRDAREAFSHFFPYTPLHFYFWESEFDSREKIKRFNSIISSLQGYILLADIDEFHIYPDCPKRLLKRGSIVWGFMVDRFKPGRRYGCLKPKPSIFSQFPEEEYYSRKKLYNYFHKPCLFDSKNELRGSHDLIDRVPASEEAGITIAHFKWTDSTKEKLIRRIEKYYPNMHWQESVKALYEIYNYKHPYLLELKAPFQVINID